MRWPVLLIGVVLFFAVIIFGFSFGSPTTSGEATTSVEILPGIQNAEYQNAQYGFSLLYPVTISPQTEGFAAFLPLTQKQVMAINFPHDFFKGTNLIEAGLYVGASAQADAVNACISSGERERFLGTKAIHGVVFSEFYTTGAAAGNLYEESIFRTVRSGTCFELVEMLHSGNIGNYEPGTVKQFDRNVVISTLDKILESFQFANAAQSGVEGSLTVRCLSDASDPGCLPQVRTIEAYQGANSVGLFKTQEDGSFSGELPPGQYELRVDTATSTHCVSVGVVVPENAFISTNISCEVGL